VKRRTVKKTYVSGQLDETRHFYYTEPSRWQVVEERVSSSTSAERQFVWGLRYIDDLILRDRDSTGDETLDERLYGMQDANWNVTSVASEVGTVQERYAYHPYGTPIVLTAAFAPCGSSSFDWETMFGGYRWDFRAMLFDVRMRVYAVKMGGWLQRDPIGYASGPNIYHHAGFNPRRVLRAGEGPYTYVGSSPLRRTDSSGLGYCSTTVKHTCLREGVFVGKVTVTCGSVVPWHSHACQFLLLPAFLQFCSLCSIFVGEGVASVEHCMRAGMAGAISHLVMETGRFGPCTCSCWLGA
jgi:RHS repeat-associated protein